MPDELQADLRRWRLEKTPEAAVDIFDLGVVFGDDRLTQEGARLIGLNRSSYDDRVIEAVSRVITPAADYRARQERTAKLELNQKYVHSTIAMLKRRVRDSPRDAISWLELARLHTILGQYGIAERYLRSALQIDPAGRLTLRAAVQFYQVVGDLSEVLPLLWASDSLRRDPWIQSAEIAAADLSGKGSRVAKTAGAAIRGVPRLDISRSELALAVATLDLGAGLRPGKVFRMVEAGLENSTENALAQGVWLGDQTPRSLHARFPAIDFSEDAHEAKARHYFEIQEYEKSFAESIQWLQDQPFQAEPFCWVANTAVTHLDNYNSIVSFAERYQVVHHNDWTVLNSCILVFASSGRLNLAAEAARAMERIAHNDIVRAFSEAAFGMIAMRSGDNFAGRAFYKKAILLARSAERRDLVASAYMFYLWGEAIVGRVSEEDINKGFLTAGKIIDRLDAESKNDAKRTLKSIKNKISVIIERRKQNAFPTQGLDVADHIIEEKDLQLDLFS